MDMTPTGSQWVLFGIGGYLSDILDIIRLLDGRVKRIVLNMEEKVRPRTKSLDDHLRSLREPPVIERLAEFRPSAGEHYNLGCTVPQRAGLVEEIRERFGIEFSPLVHPESYLGGNVRVEEGVLVGARATIGPNTVLEEFSFVNRSASVGHDVIIGPYARVGPNATLSGFTRLGAGSMVAVGATVLDRVHIGRNTILGAGAVATRDLPDDVVAVGVPASVVRDNR